jgi:hypothetical protein
MVALAAGCGAAAVVRNMAGTLRSDTILISVLLLAYPAYRIWDTYPALDRRRDTRPPHVLRELTNALTPRELLLTNLPWEVQNGLDYYTRYTSPDIVQVRVRDVLPHFAFLLWDNEAAGRRFVATMHARDEIVAAYGELVDTTPDDRVRPARIDEWLDTPSHAYVLAALAPTRDYQMDGAALNRLAQRLGGASMPAGQYAVIAGRAGAKPAIAVGGDRPFRIRSRADGLDVDVRMESWLTFDTIRRAGFGHAIVNRRHALTIERGVSYVELDEAGNAIRTRYAANIFARELRYHVRSRSVGP